MLNKLYQLEGKKVEIRFKHLHGGEGVRRGRLEINSGWAYIYEDGKSGKEYCGAFDTNTAEQLDRIIFVEELDKVNANLDFKPADSLGFMAREKPGQINWLKFDTRELEIGMENGDKKVLVLRSIWWYHAEQQVFLKDLKKFFTDKGITSLEEDGYIKFL